MDKQYKKVKGVPTVTKSKTIEADESITLLRDNLATFKQRKSALLVEVSKINDIIDDIKGDIKELEKLEDKE